MKKILTLLAAALLAAPFQTSLAAEAEPAAATRETREYQLRDFEGLDVSWTYKVQLTRANRYSVSVEAPDFIIPFLRVEVVKGVLTLGVGELPKDIRKKIEALSRSGEIRAKVSMPELTSLKMTGAAQLTAHCPFCGQSLTIEEEWIGRNGECPSCGKTFPIADDDAPPPPPEEPSEPASYSEAPSGKLSLPELTSLKMTGAAQLTAEDGFLHRNDRFLMRLSGASAVKGLSLKAIEADIDCSGAAKFELNGEFDRLVLRMSGAVSGKLESSPKVALVELSGASKTHWTGKSVKTDIEASSAASLELEGEAVELVVKASGAAKINTAKAPSRTADIKLSGAARSEIDVREELTVNLSGASSCLYHGNDRLRVSTKAVSRGSTLKRF